MDPTSTFNIGSTLYDNNFSLKNNYNATASPITSRNDIENMVRESQSRFREAINSSI